tara:strand:+ start:789 stop:941 length:153 start_codon:yes stop_codon:yes gene_type:complete
MSGRKRIAKAASLGHLRELQFLELEAINKKLGAILLIMSKIMGEVQNEDD